MKAARLLQSPPSPSGYSAFIPDFNNTEHNSTGLGVVRSICKKEVPL